MKQIDELKKLVSAKSEEVERLQQEEEMDKAVAAAKELDELVNELKLAQSMENAKNAIPKNSLRPASEIGCDQKKLANRAFNKLVFGRGQLTEAENEAYYASIVNTGQVEGTDAKGGYVVPEEQMKMLREYRKAYTALKDYCNVVQANSNAGKFPTLGEESGKLTSFNEISAITESDFDFGQKSYEIVDYGDIIPVSNQLIADADVNILNIVGQRLARKAVNTENDVILTQLATLSSTSISSYKALTKALNVDLDPVYYSNAKIFTNQDGFQWLSELEDAQNRPLMIPDVVAPDTYRFRGKEIVVLSNNILESTTVSSTTTAPIYIGNMADYIMFFERRGVEIATSEEYLFNKYATALRCVVRFGITADDTSALKAYNVTISS